jgi:hypothetical protein
MSGDEFVLQTDWLFDRMAVRRLTERQVFTLNRSADFDTFFLLYARQIASPTHATPG